MIFLEAQLNVCTEDIKHSLRRKEENGFKISSIGNGYF